MSRMTYSIELLLVVPFRASDKVSYLHRELQP